MINIYTREIDLKEREREREIEREGFKSKNSITIE
jgi:hypothetical protein